MGTNSKLHVQFSSRFWRALGLNGETYSDTGYQNTWEVTRAQAGKSGHPRRLHRRQRSARASAPARRRRGRRSSSRRSSRCCPGSTKAWNGKATIDFWPGYQWTKGSYSYWKVGQYHALRRDGGASGRATATSPASTRRSTSRAT